MNYQARSRSFRRHGNDQSKSTMASAAICNPSHVSVEMFVPTRSSKLKQKTEESCQTVVFENFKPKKNDSDAITKNSNKNSSKNNDVNLDIKKLWCEIIKFGSSGFDKEKRDESRINLAVSLGARPPKKKVKNYKELLKEKKEEKVRAAKNSESNENLVKQLKKKKPFRRIRNKNETTGLLNKYGKVNFRR